MPTSSSPTAAQSGELVSKAFHLRLADGCIAGIRKPQDLYDTEYIAQDAKFGSLFIGYRREGGEWKHAETEDLIREEPARFSVRREGDSLETEYRLGGDATPDLCVISRFRLEGSGLFWDLTFRNQGSVPLEIGDLGIPFPMNSHFVWDPVETATKGVFRHCLLSGHASFLFWMRINSVGPYLLMTPVGNAKFEYFDVSRRGERGRGFFRAYVHSLAQGKVAADKGCKWRQPHTSVLLAAKGDAKSEVHYRFKFQWANDYDHIRDLLVEEGLFDIHVVPGMTVAAGWAVRFSLRTRQRIQSIVPEFPNATDVAYLGEKAPETHVYEAHFRRLGENLLTVRYGEGRSMVLEFFVTEPIETVLRKRAAFLGKCQHRDSSKWYNGLITDWNMESGVLLSPDNYDRIKGWRIYAVTCDDPGLCKAPLMAAKNVEYPSEREIEALDYYIDHFIWGGLQCTTEEEYPYALYGIPDWKRLRESSDPGPKGRLHVWRPYDYPHVVMLYHKMYEIAKYHTRIKTLLPRREYLKRAFGTACAMFTVPLKIDKWSADKTGFYNELVIEEVITALEEEGMRAEADELRAHWERKVKCFLRDRPNLFGSEYPFDSTGFESTAALARYALSHAVDGGGPKGGPGFDVTAAEARAFLEAQMTGNLLCRGWLETAYYLLGSDYRGGGMVSYTLSYMSQMGGWGVMDYALHRTPETHKYLRLAYASYLSSWALMNTGAPESNYGYWFPGAANDGGAGGGFEPAAYGETWLEQPHHRGSWYYGCEIDLGFGGALRTANTILAEDPIFGLFAYGGEAREIENGVGVIPRDGVRRRFHVRRADKRLDLVMERDHFSAELPIEVDHDLNRIRFCLEDASGVDHTTRVTLGGLRGGRYRALREGKEVAVCVIADGKESVVRLPVCAGDKAARIEIIKARQ